MDGSSCFEPKASGTLRLAELLGALSHALDVTEGQPRGHCVRCCWIGMQIGERAGLSKGELRDLYFTLLLKDLGCSSNAARICELYLTDDLNFKRDWKTAGTSLPQVVQFVLNHTGLRSGLAQRFRSVLNIFQNGGQIARELIETRCHRGADIALQMRFSTGVADGIRNLDEHWDGMGKPERRSGETIPVAARIALLSQVIDVFHTSAGPQGARDEVRRRVGQWFDPRLGMIFDELAGRPEFWHTLASENIEACVYALEPAQSAVAVDDDYLDDIAAAFGQIVDTKSPFTSGHSTRVALYTDLIAERLGLTEARRRWLRRGALLHDLGKLGVSNSILDKPGQLLTDEWASMREHATLTAAILSRIEIFSELAKVSAAHHERLDGKGYPLGLTASQISLETRIITAADIFDALTADRPYRKALPLAQTLEIMHGLAGVAIDVRCLQALEAEIRETPLPGSEPGMPVPVHLPLREAANVSTAV